MHKEVFQINKECLNLIPEIVGLLRKQMFFEGSKRVQILIKNLGVISDYVLQTDVTELDKQEWLLILQTFLGAQENKDYILMSDILESDLLIFLQKIQNVLLAEDCVVVNEYWEKNMQCLKEVNPRLHQAILKDSECQGHNTKVQFEPTLAINGQPTLKVRMNGKEFCMHSTVNPEWEAKELAKSWLENSKPTLQIFGMGMGYHVKALLDADETIKVTVLEYRIEALMMAFNYLDFGKYFVDGRLDIIYESDIMNVLKMMNAGEEESIFFLHYPSLQCVEQREIKEILEDYFINVSTMMEQGKSLYQNFDYLQEQNLPECTVLRDTFADKNVVIVAGGPSVDDEIESLKQFRDDIAILSVGTVARKLINAGIRPDVIIVTDPQDTMYRQVEGLEADGIPLMLLSTGSKTVMNAYSGPVYLIYQYGFEPAEKVAQERGYSLFHTGGSVTTTALDVAITFGAKKVILVGADMAYTDNRSHTSGHGYEINDVSDYRQVPSVAGGTVYTSRNLDIYRKWIERRILNLKHPVVYNTSRGARIAGTVECKLKDII